MFIRTNQTIKMNCLSIIFKWDLKMKDFDYCLSIFFGFAYCMLAVCLCRVLAWGCNRVDDAIAAINDHDHHGTNDDHVVINIKELTGIDQSVLRSIPVVDFNSKDFKYGVECVVCLSELVEGDKTRVLPMCNHLFHADCIDSWLRSHSTCPICRNKVGSVQQGTRPEFVPDNNISV